VAYFNSYPPLDSPSPNSHLMENRFSHKTRAKKAFHYHQVPSLFLSIIH